MIDPLSTKIRFSYKQHFYKQSQADVNQHPEAELLLFKICSHPHPWYHPKIIRHILKKKANNKCVCIHVIMRLIIMKVKLKMKNRSHRYSINRPRTRHGHKYTKYKKCLIMMTAICIKQHVSNIWSSIHEKVEQHWGWVEKNYCLLKKNLQCNILWFVNFKFS